MGLFWPESDSDSARTVLRQTIYALRRDLRRHDLILGGADLRINSQVLTTDVGEFREALAARDLERAVARYCGPLLDGVHLDASAEFERWVDAERARLEREFRRSLETLAEDAGSARDYVAAARWWEQRVIHDPLDSRVVLACMHALASAGDRAGALRHGELHTRLLRAEFDALPDPEILAFAARLRAKEITILPEPRVDPHNQEDILCGSIEVPAPFKTRDR